MSKASAQKFIDRLKTDDDLLERVKTCKDARERTKLAVTEGYSFTADEINELKDQFTDDDARRTVVSEKYEPYDGPAGHGC